MSEYDTIAQREIAKTMKEFKRGKLTSGAKSHQKVTSRKQAIAIGLSKARSMGAKVPQE